MTSRSMHRDFRNQFQQLRHQSLNIPGELNDGDVQYQSQVGTGDDDRAKSATSENAESVVGLDSSHD